MPVFTSFTDLNARFGAQRHHGGMLKVVNAGSLSPGSPINFNSGTSKLIFCVNAYSGPTRPGLLTVTGTQVNRNTGVETAGSEELYVAHSGVDTSTTDANGNTIWGLTGCYITSNWYQNAVTVTGTNLSLTDVDIYQVAFEQLNDKDGATIDTLDISSFVLNANAWFYAYLYSVKPYSNPWIYADGVTVKLEASIAMPASKINADRWYRKRLGNLAIPINGSSEGLFLDLHQGPANQNYFESFNMKLWFTEGT
jgi:hypothetical protein